MHFISNCCLMSFTGFSMNKSNIVKQFYIYAHYTFMIYTKMFQNENPMGDKGKYVGHFRTTKHVWNCQAACKSRFIDKEKKILLYWKLYMLCRNRKSSVVRELEAYIIKCHMRTSSTYPMYYWYMCIIGLFRSMLWMWHVYCVAPFVCSYVCR